MNSSIRTIVKTSAALGALLGVLAFQPSVAHADGWHGHGGFGYRNHGWGGPVYRGPAYGYRPYAPAYRPSYGWQSGRWLHGPHLGRHAWWWIVGDSWYPYATQVAPYPPPVVTYEVPSSAPGTWYWCPSANAYYPYVSYCPEGWTPVPAQP